MDQISRPTTKIANNISAVVLNSTLISTSILTQLLFELIIKFLINRKLISLFRQQKNMHLRGQLLLLLLAKFGLL